nr:hypothetical protein GCM10025732_37430 [Glycomyces mayteni]
MRARRRLADTNRRVASIGGDKNGEDSGMNEPKILGQFQLEHRTIQVSGDDGNVGTVWLQRLHPDPPMALGCVVELDSSTPRLRLYRAEWPDALRELAKEQTIKIWRAARD